MPTHPLPGAPALRLLRTPLDGRPVEQDEGQSLLRAPRRPGERREAVTFAVGPSLQALTRAAAAEGFDLDAAITAVLERHMAERLIGDTVGPSAGDVVAALDRRAAEARIEAAVSDASAAYVRGLLDRRRRTPSLEVAGELLVALPMRLVDAVRRDDAEAAASAVRTPDAMRWELAAALRGMTLGEWAAWEALRAVVRRD